MPNQYPRKSTCSKPIKSTPENSLAELVQDYWDGHQNDYIEEDQWWTEPDTWEGVLERAWLSKMPNGKMHGHQCNNGTKRLTEGLQIASSANKSPEDFPDFDALYRWIEPTFRRLTIIFSCALLEVIAESISGKGFQKWSNWLPYAAA